MTIVITSSFSAATSPCMLGIATGGIVAGAAKLAASGTGGAAASVGFSAAAGAILSALTSKTVAGSITGAASGGITAAMTPWIASMSTGPIGYLVLGTDVHGNGDMVSRDGKITFDCWKQVLREENSAESNGMLLKDVLIDERIVEITLSDGYDPMLPRINVRNKWNEEFVIDYVFMPEVDVFSLHATPFAVNF